MTEDVLFEKRGRAGVITLNRPKQLNSLTLAMFRAMHAALDEWQADPAVELILVRGAGPKAFCAGGDIRALYDQRAGTVGPADPSTQMFDEEYRFDLRLHRSAKPFVSLTHGITFGGGAGVSVNARYGIASESTLFSMPEVFIGSIPDIGAGSFLNRCPGHLGMYLALTGARINAADAIACGLYPWLIPDARREELERALCENGAARLENLIEQFTIASGPSALLALQPEIDRCFGFASVEEIDAAVREEARRTNSDWARAAVESFDRASPLSLKLTHRQIKESRGFDLAQALTLEFRMLQHILAGPEFYAGVKAVVVDKSRNADWKYKSLKEVPDEEVARHFVQLGDRELDLSGI